MKTETDMDYKKLVEQLRSASLLHGSWMRDRMTEAADAIEALLAERDAAQKEAQDLQIQWDMYGGDEGVTVAFQKAEERDAAVEELRGECRCCAHNTGRHNVGRCVACFHETAPMPLPGFNRVDNWEWRGPQKEGGGDGQA